MDNSENLNMIRKISILFLSVAAMLVFAVSAEAQMTDEAVMAYMNEAVTSGKSQSAMAKELAEKGMTVEQFERLKQQYSGEGAVAGNAPSGTKTTAPALLSATSMDRMRKANFNMAELELDFTASLDSLELLKPKVKEVFGRNIFANKNLTFAPNLNVATPANYRLGAGDEVIIDIWGTNETTVRQTISPDGFINIPGVGLVGLNGMTVKEADSYLRKKMGRIYPVDGDEANSDIKLTLGNIRTIQVNVVGEVVSPGTYFIPSLSTVYNALYLAGGISEVGSLREISLVRNNRTIAVVDIYDFILNGKSADDIMLQDGDIITVPAYKNLVDMAGKVKRPMSYEMRDDESVRKALDYAGGFTGDAYKANIRLIRRNGVEYQVFTVDSLKYDGFMLRDGDSLTIEPMIDRYENKVEIMGSVYRPGAYQLCDEISTVSQLIRKAEGLMGDAFTNRALLYREKEDLTREVISVDLKAALNGTIAEIPLQNNDSLHVSSIHDIKDIGTVTIDGEVTNPGTFPFIDNMTIEDLIIQSGGLLESASTVRIDVSRRIKNQTSKEQPDSIGQIYTLTIKDGYAVDGPKDFVLEPYDQVSVRRSPGYFEQTSVTITGEVIFPGSYVLTHKTERLSDLVKKAGGVNSWAYVKGARLQRQMNEDEKRRVESAVDFLDAAKDSIDVAKIEMEASYYVGIDLGVALANPGSDADLVLREGDQLIVPEYVNTVKISGNVMYPNTVTYDPDFRVRDYVEMAGGYGYHSKRSKAYVIYMNGTVKKARKLSKGVIEPGCEVVVPQRRQKDSSLAEVLSIATTSSSVATMLATMGNLVSSFIK